MAHLSDNQPSFASHSFRLLVWNCAGGFHRKHAFVKQFDPDLAIICELTNKSLSMLHDVSKSTWIGRPAALGVALVSYKNWEIQNAGFDIPERWFLPATVSNGKKSIRIVGVCAQKAENYVAPTLRAIRQMETFIGDGPSIVAGDFNQSPLTDHKYPPGQRSSDTFAAMTALQMRSAWHWHFEEPHGQESVPTHYWGANRKPFHIDYAFVSRHLVIKQVHITPFDAIAGVSDHAALVIDFHIAS